MRYCTAALFFQALTCLPVSAMAGGGFNSTEGTPLPIGAGGNTAMTILPNGNIGLGTENPSTLLDVNGDVKIGKSSAICSKSNEGSLRYDNQKKLFLGCNGNSWVSLSSGFDNLNWYNVTSIRALGSPYINTTGHPIQVSVSTYSGPNGSRCASSIFVDGISLGYQFINNSIGAAMCNSTAIIPAGATYVAHNDGWPDITLFSWSELR